MLSEVEREITKTVVRRFLDEKESSRRSFLARKHRSSQAFHRLRDSGILRNATQNAATVDEVYLPRALAFYYCGDPDALQTARESVTVVIHALQNLFDAEPDKKAFRFEDLTAAANNIAGPRPGADTLNLGLYLVRDLGFLASYPSEETQSEPFQIAERILEIRDVNKVWDDFIARSTVAYGGVPHSEVDLSDSDILIESEGFDRMARTPRVAQIVPHQPTIPTDLALHRLQKYLDQIERMRSSGP